MARHAGVLGGYSPRPQIQKYHLRFWGTSHETMAHDPASGRLKIQVPARHRTGRALLARPTRRLRTRRLRTPRCVAASCGHGCGQRASGTSRAISDSQIERRAGESCEGQHEILGTDRIARIGATLGFAFGQLPDRITLLPVINQPARGRHRGQPVRCSPARDLHGRGIDPLASFRSRSSD